MHFEQRFGAREIKFLVTPERGEQIRRWARERLSPDPNAAGGDTYRVTSLYFDTCAFDVFHARGSYGRAKYRVRRYDDAPTVFAERKMRTESLVTKRRVSLDLAEIGRLASGRGWFERRLAARSLKPVCSITYLRSAFVGSQTNGSLTRLTIDQCLHAAQVDHLTLGCPDQGLPICNGQEILELKYLGEMPRVFKDLLETFPVQRTGVSKYRLAAAALGLATKHA